MLSIICRTLGKNNWWWWWGDPHDQMVVKILFILPFCLRVFGYYQSCFQVILCSCILIAIFYWTLIWAHDFEQFLSLHFITSCFWQTNTSLRSHYHLIQWLVHHLHLVFQTKGLVLYSICKSAFQLEIWMLLDVAYYNIMSPLVAIMKSKDTLFHYPKCLLQTLIWYVDYWFSILQKDRVYLTLFEF